MYDWLLLCSLLFLGAEFYSWLFSLRPSNTPASRGAKAEPNSRPPPPQRLPAPITARLRAGALGGRGERHVIPLCGSIRRRCRTTCDDSNGYLRGERGPPVWQGRAAAVRTHLVPGQPLTPPPHHPPPLTGATISEGTGGRGGCTNAGPDLIQRDRLQRPAEDVSFYAPASVLPPTNREGRGR